MKVQTRLALLVGTVAAALLVTFWALDRSASKDEQLLVNSLQAERERQLEGLVTLSGRSLQLFAQEYSDWDQMVTFVSRPDETWARINIEEALPTLGVEAAWVFDAHLSPVYSINLANRMAPLPLPVAVAELPHLTQRARRAHFFAYIGSTVWEIRSAPIHGPDDPEGAPVIAGWLFAGRRWTPETLADLARLSRGTVSLTPPGAVAGESPRDYGWIAVHMMLPSAGGAPVAALHLHVQPAPLMQAREHRHLVWFTLAAFGVGSVGLLILGTRRWVARPIQTLARSLTESNREELVRLEKSSSEFGHLARLVQTSFIQQEALRREIDERRRAEIALVESEIRYKQLFENSRIGVYRATPTGRIVAANPALLALLGYSSVEALDGRDLNDTGIRHTHGPEFAARMTAEGEVRGFESEWHRRDGTLVHVRENAWVVRDAAGQVIFHDGAVEDVSEQHHAREAMREVFGMLNSVDDAVLINDVETLRFVYVNDGAVRHLGYSREELLNLTTADIDPDTDRTQMHAWNDVLRRGDRRTLLLQTRHRRKDRRLVDVEVRVQYFSPPGAVPMCLALARDITERRNAEQHRLRAQRLESIGTLAGGVAHDLNNIFTPVLMFVHDLRMRPRVPEPDVIQMVETSVRRGANMVRQLLTFGKGIEGERRVLDPAELVREIAAIIGSTFPKAVTVNVKLAADAGPVLGDPTQLHQVLLNLSVNARDAMNGDGILTLCTRDLVLDGETAARWSDAKPGRYTVITVSDTGPGIPPEIVDRIFEPFFTTKGLKGTGLGLATVLGIVRSHGGTVHVESERGRGAAFHVLLPVANGRPAAAVPAATGRCEGRQRQVLIVDDEPAIRLAGAVALRQMRFRVIEADSGAAALKVCIEHGGELDVVITDLSMPEVGGLTVLRTLKERNSRACLIAMSGRFETHVRAELAAMGVHLLQKPFDRDELARVVAAALGT